MLGPKGARRANQERQFSSLIFGGDSVADNRRCEAALGAQPQPFHWHVSAGFVYAPLQKSQGFQLRLFRRYQSQRNELILWHVAERFKGAGAGVVEFQQ
jgi:hypothetical protein